MADNADARARGAIERIFAQAKKRDTIKGFVGKPNGNGTYTIYTGYAPGWVYVRLTDAVDGSIAIAIAMNTNLDPAVEVEMERVDGMLVIKSAVPAQAARLYGNSTPQAQQPPAQQPPAGYTNKAGGELSLVTKDGTALGGRVVRITPYRHRGGWWPGTDTITLTPTSTSGQRAWVLVGINTKTNAITQALSTNRSVGFTPFPESDVDAVINAYPDVDWRAAVNLANGETSIDATDILDLTNRGETKPKSNYTATAAPGVGDDIDDGYGVGSIWIDVTNDHPYQCVDATAGAAVWRQLDAGSSGGSPAFGAGVIKTLSSDVATAGSDRHLIIAAETGTTDNLIEISGLSVGDEVILRADAGDTITVKHNDAGATDKIILYGAADMILSGDKTLKVFKSASGKVVQYVDDSTTGSAPSTGKYITYGYDSTNTAEKAIPRLEFDADLEPASPNAADDEFAGSSLGGSWSWVNQGSASAAVAKSHLLLTVPSTSTGNIRGIFRTYPGQSTWEAKITGWSRAPVWSGANNYSFAITRRDSGTGRLENFAFSWSSSSTALLVIYDRWTNPTTFSATVATIQLSRLTFGTFYLQLIDDNTNVALKWSIDGVNYTQLTSFARAAFLANADQIGLTVFTQQASGNIYLQSDWMRRTA